MSLFKERKSYY
jgi:DnaJ-class molecular chaperone